MRSNSPQSKTLIFLGRNKKIKFQPFPFQIDFICNATINFNLLFSDPTYVGTANWAVQHFSWPKREKHLHKNEKKELLCNSFSIFG